MDIRAAIAGTIALVALVGLIVLAALGITDVVDKLDAIIGTALGLLFGLYSSPYTGPNPGVVEPLDVDEPAGVTRAEAAFLTADLGLALAALAITIAWVVGIVALVLGWTS